MVLACQRLEHRRAILLRIAVAVEQSQPTLERLSIVPARPASAEPIPLYGGLLLLLLQRSRTARRRKLLLFSSHCLFARQLSRMRRLPLRFRCCLCSLLLVDYVQVVFVTAVGTLVTLICVIFIITHPPA